MRGFICNGTLRRWSDVTESSDRWCREVITPRAFVLRSNQRREVLEPTASQDSEGPE